MRFVCFTAVCLTLLLASCTESEQTSIPTHQVEPATAVSPSSTPFPTATPFLQRSMTLPSPTITASPTVTATPSPTLPPTFTPFGPRTIPADHPYISYIGRFDFTHSAAPKFDWIGATIEAAFNGPSLTLLLEDGNNLYNLYVDGVPTVLRTVAGQDAYLAASNLNAGQHSFRLVKRTEFEGASGIFRGFVLPSGGDIQEPPPRPTRRIEVIGDSITAGYGVEGESPTCSYSAATQNVEQTYAAMLGRIFQAEMMTTAVSGIGVIRNYNEPDMISAAPMTARYERALSYELDSRWDFQRWKPDVIIINLGTNDFSTTPYPSQAIFVQAYIDLLNTIRRHYPLTPILAMSPPIIQEPANWYVQTAVTHLNSNQSDPNVHYLPMTNNLIAPQDYGCDYHPNIAGQQKITDQIVPALQRIMGW
ncbi:MAG: endoglucanase [Chloroflexi bacterium]|nr:endoglucanase [Chloroflexota bacterium]